MSRVCYDAINVLDLPPGADLYAGYDDGKWPDAAAIAAKFPGKVVLRITVFSTDNEGDVLDVEYGDATPAQAPDWVERRRAAGHGGPIVYCSESSWADVQKSFSDMGVAQPGYWIAAYPGVGAALYPGSVGHQYVDHGEYDESVFVDYLPGIDPQPIHVPEVPVRMNIPCSAPIADVLECPSGGVWILLADGAIFAVPSEPGGPTAPFLGAAKGQPYFTLGRVAANLTHYGKNGYTITDTAGETYHYGS
jgi:hypothetical protein